MSNDTWETVRKDELMSSARPVLVCIFIIASCTVFSCRAWAGSYADQHQASDQSDLFQELQRGDRLVRFDPGPIIEHAYAHSLAVTAIHREVRERKRNLSKEQILEMFRLAFVMTNLEMAFEPDEKLPLQAAKLAALQFVDAAALEYRDTVCSFVAQGGLSAETEEAIVIECQGRKVYRKIVAAWNKGRLTSRKAVIAMVYGDVNDMMNRELRAIKICQNWNDFDYRRKNNIVLQTLACLWFDMCTTRR